MVSVKQKTALLRYYQTRKKRVEQRLSEIIGDMSRADHGDLTKALGYTLTAGGKRIRPVLAMTIYDLFDRPESDILDAACALEMLHASSLMLDDLPGMDDAQTRRGKDTAHVHFSESTTILAAAALWTKTYEILSGYPLAVAPELSRFTAELTGANGLVLGQYYDLESRTKHFSIDELVHQYSLKTASMFRLAVGYGAILGGASAKQRTALDEYAYNLGIAFQIHDDIVDATMTTLESGKDAHIDSVNHKQNFISTIGLEASEQQFGLYISKAAEALSDTGLKVANLQYFTDSLLD